VVFLQHPRERTVAIGTARMAHLSLSNSELHIGVDFSSNERVRTLVEHSAEEGVALLFPGPGAKDLSELSESERPRVVVVLDGTWSNAGKLLRRNPLLQQLPRVQFTPSKPGNYRIRREPAEHCVSTIEAVVEVLGLLEGDDARFETMLRPFDWMVDHQLERRATRSGPPRIKLPRQRNPVAPAVPPELLSRANDLVALYGEANAHPRETTPPIPAELVHLCAERLATRERLEIVLAPRRPLAVSTPHHLGLSEQTLRSGAPLDAALARLRAFLRPSDLICGWGPFTLDLLRDEGEPERNWVDVRRATSRWFKRRPGGIEPASKLLGSVGECERWAEGRAGIRVAELARVIRALQLRVPIDGAT
jgi:DTW domain-containing protein YfiP